MSEGIKLIAAERQRQIEQEGWTPEHDDQHAPGELLAAAICYAICCLNGSSAKPPLWPWGAAWWKPKAPVRNLTKAGALIAAEIDRLLRAREENAEVEGR